MASLFNPVVYLISGFRWSFYGIADVSVGVSLAMNDDQLPGRVPGDGVVDLQDGVPAQNVVSASLDPGRCWEVVAGGKVAVSRS
jgi:hypothetical protein